MFVYFARFALYFRVRVLVDGYELLLSPQKRAQVTMGNHVIDYVGKLLICSSIRLVWWVFDDCIAFNSISLVGSSVGYHWGLRRTGIFVVESAAWSALIFNANTAVFSGDVPRGIS